MKSEILMKLLYRLSEHNNNINGRRKDYINIIKYSLNVQLGVGIVNSNFTL